MYVVYQIQIKSNKHSIISNGIFLLRGKLKHEIPRYAKIQFIRLHYPLSPTPLCAACRAGLGLFFPTRFGFRALFFSPVRFGQKIIFIRVFLGSKLLLFGPVSGPIYKGGFYFSEYNLIFLGLIIQEIKFLVGFSRVCPHFHVFAHVFLHFYWVRVARVKNISPRVTSGSPKRDPVRFGFLKTREPQIKFWVGFGPDPALPQINFFSKQKIWLWTNNIWWNNANRPPWNALGFENLVGGSGLNYFDIL